MTPNAFETLSLKMEPCFRVAFQAPEEDVDRIMEAVCHIDPLRQGAYDSSAFQSGPGIERYRPRSGAMAGLEDALRKRPGVVEISFHLPHDQDLLARVVEAIYQVHVYQEPTISVALGLLSQTKGLDDKDNPHRWWNKAGDWKKQS